MKFMVSASGAVGADGGVLSGFNADASALQHSILDPALTKVTMMEVLQVCFEVRRRDCFRPNEKTGNRLIPFRGVRSALSSAADLVSKHWGRGPEGIDGQDGPDLGISER